MKPTSGKQWAAGIFSFFLTVLAVTVPGVIHDRMAEKQARERTAHLLPITKETGYYLDETAGSTGEFLTVKELVGLSERELLEKAGTGTTLIFEGAPAEDICGRKAVPAEDLLVPGRALILLSEEDIPSPGENLYVKADCVLKGYCVADSQYGALYTDHYPVLEITDITTGDFFTLDCPVLETAEPAVEAAEEGVKAGLTKIEYGEKYARIYLTLENQEDRPLGIADSEFLCNGKELEEMRWSPLYLKYAGLPVLTSTFAGAESKQQVIITAGPLDPDSRLEFSWKFVTAADIYKNEGYITLDEPVCTLRLEYDPEA